MSGKDVFAPRKLSGLLKELTPRFFLPSEFPGRQPDSAVPRLLDAAAGLTGGALERFSFELKSAEVESLILSLPAAEDRDEALISQILKVRANRRIVELFWPFFQYHFENNNVLQAAKTLLPQLPKDTDDSAGCRNLRLFAFDNGFASLLEKLLAAGAPLGVFAAGEALLVDSPLAARLFEYYFCECGKDGFLLNERRLLRVLSTLPGKAGEKILINYLGKLDRLEFLPSVNSYILGRWGEPYSSPDWADIPQALRQKFAEWISYRRLAEHFVKNKLKLRILNTVVPYMRQVRLSSDAKFMAADFGEFYIVDDNELSSYSYFVERDLFEKLGGDSENTGLEDIRTSAKTLVDARAFMIEETEDSFIQLEYEELGRLYIMDMLGIKLNITPDLRPSKTLIRKKRQATGTR